ncbi:MULTISPECIES: methyl-accepting chemotaxis protein [unclassified Paenibacillus]|uniref:methyl-accepting chemotaxis protein n=1 Tax=unclassified Paenibacillus TaxID=185978 RepID=UPI001AEAE88C|nr:MULTISPECIES: methyl-accepting chemotaxis protein [unclassified Paenibacillus]MBP1154948.1 methyl-accepting chemotaxis protein [Paenibacillus sp. PvP091]MBP1169668.1 methyl-accepting chemotaxis protein [Paenibacillus sp. PvR098]MBP2440696.1 methyl-accepting chemotaxis protein [Paenibacillus sp. PvP052]
MKWFYDLKTSVKLISAFVFMAILLACVGFFGLNNMGKLNDEITITYNDRLIPINDLSSSQILYQRIRVNIRDMNFVANTPEAKNNYEQRIQELKIQIDANIDKYSKTGLDSQAQELLKKFDPAWQAYKGILDQAIQSAHAGDVEGYLRLAPGFREVGDQAETILQELISLNIQTAEKANQEANATYASSRTITITIILASLLFSIGFGYFISQIISRPLNRVVGLVDKVAGGDLRETADIDTKDEIGQLANSINDMVLSLRTTVSGIMASAESVAAASQQISATTEEIASGTTSQANDAQTMNELFKELSNAIDSVAKGAEQASELSNSTVGIAQEGGKVVRFSIEGMQLVNQQMSRLEEDSNKIGEIIEVIDDIAEQTNLLALNAAIEAARAGDQGRGFAVVADEVRKLAERSGEATKQITAIIKGMQVNTQQSVKAVGEGVVSSQKTGEAFEHIITMVNESAHKVTEIAAASEEQSAQSSEVLASIESISASTEEAAAASEETASTAQSLAGLADELNSAVSIFRVR